MMNEAVKHKTSTSYSHWLQFAITLRSQNLYLGFPLTAICYHALRTIALFDQNLTQINLEQTNELR